jgi:hypothetical protein
MKIALFFWSLFFLPNLWAQEMVDWKYSFQNESQEVVLIATIQEGWHLYSQKINNEIGPVPTSFEFSPNENITLISCVAEPKAIQKYDENFEATLDFFIGEVVFKQKIELTESTQLVGSVYYMVCNETMCLPPIEEKFTLDITLK